MTECAHCKKSYGSIRSLVFSCLPKELEYCLGCKKPFCQNCLTDTTTSTVISIPIEMCHSIDDRANRERGGKLCTKTCYPRAVALWIKEIGEIFAEEFERRLDEYLVVQQSYSEFNNRLGKEKKTIDLQQYPRPDPRIDNTTRKLWYILY